MTAVVQANNTYAYIEQKVRRLTGSASQSSLTSASIQDYVNRFYQSDFPYAIKLDQTRQVYKFLTIPNVDRYPVDVNNGQGFRAPVYFEGIPGNFFKNRDQLYNLYPRFPTQFQQGAGVSGSITNVTQANPANVTSVAHQLQTGSVITITNVVGMTQLNGNTFTVTVTGPDNFTLNGIDSTGFTAYVSGGNFTSSNTFSFTLFGNNQNPFPQNNYGILSSQVVIGGIDQNGNPIRIVDDGGAVTNAFGIGSNTTSGRLLFVNTNNVGNNVYLTPTNTQMPAIPPLSPLGGGNTYYNASYPAYPPNPLTPQYCGTVNYITTQINLLLPVPIQAGSQLNIWAAQYQTGRPYCLLFWNNEFTIRPVPDDIYLVEIEQYLTPVAFMMTTDSPVLNQWVKYIALGASIDILRDRQDMEGVQNLMEAFKEQEGLALERQAVEELFQPNITIFNSSQLGYNAGIGNFGVSPGW